MSPRSKLGLSVALALGALVSCSLASLDELKAHAGHDPGVDAGHDGSVAGSGGAWSGGGQAGAPSGGGSAGSDASSGGVAGIGSGGSDAGGGSGGAPDMGCSDGTRELFTDPALHPKIAGCSGGWSVEGVASPQSMTPACNRVSGNTSSNPTGAGCSVADLCALGWHVCADWTEVSTALAGGTCETPSSPGLFAVRAGTQPTTDVCSPGQVNNVLGCGAGIGVAPSSTCAPLNRQFHIADCTAAAAWDCGGAANSSTEALHVIKTASDQGGALCCKT